MQRWMTGVAEDKKATLIPAGWFDAWANATWATDPVGAKTNPPVIRAPNGVLADSNDYWSAGKAYYDPAKCCGTHCGRARDRVAGERRLRRCGPALGERAARRP